MLDGDLSKLRSIPLFKFQNQVARRYEEKKLNARPDFENNFRFFAEKSRKVKDTARINLSKGQRYNKCNFFTESSIFNRGK